MNTVKKIFRNHTLISIYTIVFGILLIGVFKHSGFDHFPEMMIYYLSLILLYSGIRTVFKKINLDKLLDKLSGIGNLLSSNIMVNVLFVSSTVFIITHLIYLGGLPALEGWSMTKSSELVFLRRNITAEAHPLWNYISSINVKALIPFTILLLLVRKEKWKYWFFLLLSVVYVFSLMQKSYIMTILIPVIIYAIFNKKFWLTTKFIAICMITIVSLIVLSNPALRGGWDDEKKFKPAQEDTTMNDVPYPIRVAVGLGNRMFITPGEMVNAWFEHIPEDKPFLYGCGYQFIAPLKGCEFEDYAMDLYPIVRPHYAEQGFVGSVNAASFMYEYSNFGRAGLVLSGFILALIFVFIETIFKTDAVLKTALNFFPIFLLSSGAITTMLFSGGWAFTILLFFIFRNQLKHE